MPQPCYHKPWATVHFSANLSSWSLSSQSVSRFDEGCSSVQYSLIILLRLGSMSLHFMFLFQQHLWTLIKASHGYAFPIPKQSWECNSFFDSLLLFILCTWPSHLTCLRLFSMRISAIDDSPVLQQISPFVTLSFLDVSVHSLRSLWLLYTSSYKHGASSFDSDSTLTAPTWFSK